RSFKFKLLKYLYPEENVIKESLNKLIKKKIIVEKSLLPERIYSFKLKFVQEVVFSTLLVSARKDIQKKIESYKQ
ncbi:MAG: hypothetical protein SNJ64_05005, partial [Endomicrobiia bacterium]